MAGTEVTGVTSAENHFNLSRKMIDPDDIYEAVEAVKLGVLALEKDKKAIAQAISLVDLTTLNDSDTAQTVSSLCIKAIKAKRDYPELPAVAAVCVLPQFVLTARQTLEGSGIKVASVAGDFPKGTKPLPEKVAEVAKAVSDGADEIDIVLNRELFRAGRIEEVAAEVRAMKEACGKAHLKVIIELCDLEGSNDYETMQNIYRASMISMDAGADFIKTSTGKGKYGATLDGSIVMIMAIADFEEKTKRQVGFKAAGGIKEVKSQSDPTTPTAQLNRPIVSAMQFMEMFRTSGKKVNAANFRIGASSLFDNLIKES